MQSNFKVKQLKSAKKVLAQDLDMASQQLDHYKEIQDALLEERTKKPSLWQKVMLFLRKYI